jgi:hypothetical protein
LEQRVRAVDVADLSSGLSALTSTTNMNMDLSGGLRFCMRFGKAAVRATVTEMVYRIVFGKFGSNAQRARAWSGREWELVRERGREEDL